LIDKTNFEKIKQIFTGKLEIVCVKDRRPESYFLLKYIDPIVWRLDD